MQWKGVVWEGVMWRGCSVGVVWVCQGGGCCGGVYHRHMYGCYRQVLPQERRGLQPVTTVHGQASWRSQQHGF